MKGVKKSLLVLGTCLVAVFCQTQAFGISVSNVAEVTFWIDGYSFPYRDPVSGTKPDDVKVNQTNSEYGLSGAAKATVRESSSLGAYSSVSDAGLPDSNFPSSSSDAIRSIFLNVTSGGTIIYDLSVSGSLSALGDYYFSLGKATVTFGSRLAQEGFPYETVSGTAWEGSAEIAKQSGSWVYTTSGALGNSTTNQSSASVNASTHIVTGNLTPGLYRLYMSLEASTSCSNMENEKTASATSDFYNSFGFGGTDVDFWDIVGGTACFHDRDDPSNQYNGVVPLPGALLLLGAGLARLARYAGRKS